MKQRFTSADLGIHAILLLTAAMMILPFYNVFIQSFATPAAVARQPLYLIPTVIDFSSYELIFKGREVWDALGVSLFVTLAGTAVNMITTVFGAYALTKKRMPGNRIFVGLVIFQMLFHGGIVPTYLAMKDYHLLNNVFAMILPVMVNTYYLIIMMSYFRNVPEALEEAGRIDGANDIQILMRIILPISLPTIAAISLFYAVDRWNEWWHAMIYIQDVTKQPLQLYLRQMLSDVSQMMSADLAADFTVAANVFTNGIKMAMVVVTVIPIMLVYPWLQRYFTSGVMIGAVKE
ncbi:carbohydrate ABC transporter permease [Cohnella fermenti]|uniref:Carbohydrate ABC transporter permease n=1 Tax=Cohnella fermenti TaxID=2565925 RepID=A0A4S4BLQ2_9BACL|nr:carbohydrate ABC transporter permease [Cohnella fermenti]THF75708.1 carbohydrate ABC transporter permease [Cohnella fermenti]